MDEYLVDYEVPEETMEKVYELNKKYNKIVEDNEDVSRNVNWKLVDFEFDNFFNYGDGNKVLILNELSGIVGIFGKNFLVKAASLLMVCFGLFLTQPRKMNVRISMLLTRIRDYGSGK